MVAFTAPLSRSAESYRAVRTSVLFQQQSLLGVSEIAAQGAANGNGSNGNGAHVPGAPGPLDPGGVFEPVQQAPLVLLVTSASPREGKTNTCANIAATFAEAGAHVLIVNCDFRRPSVHRLLGVDDEPRKVCDTKIPGVKIVTNVLSDAGANPSQVAAAQRQVIAAARERFDVVMLDTAPVLTANDAIEIVGAADFVLLVARAGKTTTDKAERTMEMLTRLEVPMAGCGAGGVDRGEQRLLLLLPARPGAEPPARSVAAAPILCPTLRTRRSEPRCPRSRTDARARSHRRERVPGTAPAASRADEAALLVAGRRGRCVRAHARVLGVAMARGRMGGRIRRSSSSRCSRCSPPASSFVPRTPSGRFDLAGLMATGLALRFFASFYRFTHGFDAYTYDHEGDRLAESFRHFNFGVDAQAAVPGTGGMKIIAGVVTVITGENRVAKFLIFSWLGFLGCYFLYRAFVTALPNADHHRYALLIFLWPTLLFWPSSIGKDCWMLLTLGIASLGAAKVLDAPRTAATPCSLRACCSGSFVRPHVSLMALLAFGIALLIGRRHSTRPGVTPSSIAKVAGLVVLIAIGGVVASRAASVLNVDDFSKGSIDSALTTNVGRTDEGGSTFSPPTRRARSAT